METQQIDDYLEVEFGVLQPSDLSEQDRIIAYERLKHKLLFMNLSPDDYTQAIINLAKHLHI